MMKNKLINKHNNDFFRSYFKRADVKSVYAETKIPTNKAFLTRNPVVLAIELGKQCLNFGIQIGDKVFANLINNKPIRVPIIKEHSVVLMPYE